MLYRIRHKAKRRLFEREIAGILETPPIQLIPGPCTIVSMVADWDVPMYLLALKSLYSKLGQGQVVAIIASTMSAHLRGMLTAHVPEIELVALEQIATGACQRGGTWERLAYIVERAHHSYVIQMDADILCVAADVGEVVACVRENRSFAMADGFPLQSLGDAAAMAEETPSDYIGIVTERAFAEYPNAAGLRYVRASSGFAGFAKGGFPQSRLDEFHRTMGTLVGEKRWRKWGTEQCASNFVVANSPDPVVLPNPAYGSFTPLAVPEQAKLLHFIGKFRFDDGYFAARAAEVIAGLLQSNKRFRWPPRESLLAILRQLTPASIVPFLKWLAFGGYDPVTIQFRQQPSFRPDVQAGARLVLRGRGAEFWAAQQTFVSRSLLPPVWIPPERVRTVVDLAAGTGAASVWFLANYWRASVAALSTEPEQVRATAAVNGMSDRLTLIEDALNPFGGLANRKVDLARLPARLEALRWLEQPMPDIGVIVVEPVGPFADRTIMRCREQLERLGYLTYAGRSGTLWAYRDQPWCGVGPERAAIAA